MFADGVFTTVWFADYGQDAALRPDDKYVYAYGLDGNWRDSFTDAVDDPTELFLARVPVDSVQDASTWEFYSGPPAPGSLSLSKGPRWTADIAEKKPVLTDDRRTGYDTRNRFWRGFSPQKRFLEDSAQACAFTTFRRSARSASVGSSRAMRQ